MTERTIESVAEKIKRYGTRGEFQRNCFDDYVWLKEQGRLDLLDAVHPKKGVHPLTLDYVLERARRCESFEDFQRRYYRHFYWARENGVVAEVEKILPRPDRAEVSRRISEGKRAYTDDELREHAKQFMSRTEWCAAGKLEQAGGKPSHFVCARKKGREFMRSCCGHMPPPPPPRLGRYEFSDEFLLADARKHETRGAWKRAPDTHYQIARARPIWDECIAHMRPAANPYAKDYVVYAYEFSDRHVYVGLSVVPENRRYSHRQRGPVFDHAAICPDQEFHILESGLAWQEVGAVEEKWQMAYEAEGWMPLHTAKAGCLGNVHGSKWSKEAVLAEAAKFKTRQEWIDGSQLSYRTAIKNGWFDEAVVNMPKVTGQANIGIPKSDEARAKMSAAAKIRAADPVWRANHSAALKGRPLTEGHKTKISEALVGKPKSDEHAAAISAGLTGRVLSPEHCASMSAAMTGTIRAPYKTRVDALPEDERCQRRLETYRRSYQKRREGILTDLQERNEAERLAAWEQTKIDRGLPADTPMPERITHLSGLTDEQLNEHKRTREKRNRLIRLGRLPREEGGQNENLA